MKQAVASSTLWQICEADDCDESSSMLDLQQAWMAANASLLERVRTCGMYYCKHGQCCCLSDGSIAFSVQRSSLESKGYSPDAMELQHRHKNPKD